MLLTEKQAAFTWCPQQPRREADQEDSTIKRALPSPDTPPATGCIGSKCMAWRWKADPEARAALANQVPMYVGTGEKWQCKHCNGTGGVLSPDDDAFTRDCPECEGEGNGTLQAPVGFCGLAGALELLR